MHVQGLVDDGLAGVITRLGLRTQAAADLRAITPGILTFPIQRFIALAALSEATPREAELVLREVESMRDPVFGDITFRPALREAFRLLPGAVSAALVGSLPNGRPVPAEAAPWLHVAALDVSLAQGSPNAKSLVEAFLDRAESSPDDALGLRPALLVHAIRMTASAPLPASERATLVRRAFDSARPNRHRAVFLATASAVGQLGDEGTPLLLDLVREGLAQITAPGEEAWWLFFEVMGAAAGSAAELGHPDLLRSVVHPIGDEAARCSEVKGREAEDFRSQAMSALFAAAAAAKTLGDDAHATTWREAALGPLRERQVSDWNAAEFAQQAVRACDTVKSTLWRLEALKGLLVATGEFGSTARDGNILRLRLAAQITPEIVARLGGTTESRAL